MRARPHTRSHAYIQSSPRGFGYNHSLNAMAACAGGGIGQSRRDTWNRGQKQVGRKWRGRAGQSTGRERVYLGRARACVRACVHTAAGWAEVRCCCGARRGTARYRSADCPPGVRALARTEPSAEPSARTSPVTCKCTAQPAPFRWGGHGAPPGCGASSPPRHLPQPRGHVRVPGVMRAERGIA